MSVDFDLPRSVGEDGPGISRFPDTWLDCQFSDNSMDGQESPDIDSWLSPCDFDDPGRVKMSATSNVVAKKRKKTEKSHSQINKCLNEKRRRAQDNIYIEELADLISASLSDMNSLPAKSSKRVILQETINQIKRIKEQESGSSDAVQQSDVSSSKPSILANDVLGPMLLEALDGFLFVVNTEGKIEFVSENVASFLKYTQDDLVGKSIYNIIHVGDHATFSSSLLPMSLGNSIAWSADSNPLGKSRSYNARFLNKPPSDEEVTMEEKQVCVSQYENMQVSAVLLPYPGEKSEAQDTNSADAQNCLVCVARRIPSNERTNSQLGVEQFTTQQDLTGKILAFDTSGISVGQYINKDNMVGKMIQDFYHPSDRAKLNSFHKGIITMGHNTSSVYRFKVDTAKYVYVMTNSRLFREPTETAFIMSTHSIIKQKLHPSYMLGGSENGQLSTWDSELSTTAPSNISNTMINQTNMVTSESNASTNSISLATSTAPASSSSNNSTLDFSLNDFPLDLPTSSTWGDFGSNSSSETAIDTLDTDALPNISHSNVVRSWNTQSPSPQSSSRQNFTSSEHRSPSMPSSASSPVQFSLFPSYSPGGKSTSATSSNSALQGGGHFMGDSSTTYGDDNRMSADKSNMPMSEGSNSTKKNHIYETYSSSKEIKTEKNRHILEQDGSEVSSEISDELNTSYCNAESTSDKCPDSGGSNSNSNTLHGNAILVELLNQDDDQSLGTKGICTVDNIKQERVQSSAEESGKKMDSNAQQSSWKSSDKDPLLKKLLNDDSAEKKANLVRKQQSVLLTQLLQEDPNEEKSNPGNTGNSNPGGTDIGPSGKSLEDTFHKNWFLEDSLSRSSSESKDNLIGFVNNPDAHSQPSHQGIKRKNSMEEDSDSSPTGMKQPSSDLSKKNWHLVQLLNEVPKQCPTVPTTIAVPKMNETPQESLPKNLGSKIRPTPISTNTALSAGNIMASTLSTRRLSQGNIGRPVMSNELAQAHNIQSAPSTPNAGPKVSSSVLDSLLSTTYSGRAQQMSQQQTQQESRNLTAVAQSISESRIAYSTSLNLNQVQASEMSGPSPNSGGNSDPTVDNIIQLVYEMTKEMECDQNMMDDNTLINHLEILLKNQDLPLERPTSASNQFQTDMNEEMAIDAIQKQLMMDCESSTPTTNSLASPGAMGIVGQSNIMSTTNKAVYSQNYSSNNATPLDNFQMTNNNGSYMNYGKNSRFQTPASNAGLSTTNQTLPPQMRPNMAASTPVQMPYNNTSNVTMQMRQTILIQQRQMRDQRRLLQQQQQQQQILLQSQQRPLNEAQYSAQANTGPPPSFSENMSDLINTVAPNVSLQHPSQNIPTSPGYNSGRINQVSGGLTAQAQSQISPRLSQQYGSMTQQQWQQQQPQQQIYLQQTQQQARMSPHVQHPTSLPQSYSPSPHYNQAQMSPQPQTAQPQWNQRQAQTASTTIQQQPAIMQSSQFAGPQSQFQHHQRQFSTNSLPSPGARQSPYSSSEQQFVSSPTGQPQLYTQQSQNVRMQRAISVPARVNSPRTPQASFPQDPMLSPQPQMSPAYNPNMTHTASAVGQNYTTNTTPGIASAPPAYSSQNDSTHFSFDTQALQSFGANNTNFTDRSFKGSTNQSNNMMNSSSEYVRQEVRAICMARTQQQQQQQQGKSTNHSQQPSDFDIGYGLDVQTAVTDRSHLIPPAAPTSTSQRAVDVTRQEAKQRYQQFQAFAGHAPPEDPEIKASNLFRNQLLSNPHLNQDGQGGLQRMSSRELPQVHIQPSSSPRQPAVEDIRATNSSKSLLQQLLSD